MTCINPQHIKDIEADLRTNGFSLARVSKYKRTTQERLEYFDKFVNDRSESEYLNNKIERFLLNNQKENMKLWAKKAGKKGIDTSTTKSLLDKIDSLSKVLGNTSQDKPFLNGLVKQKLGFYVTQDEANQIKSMNDNIIASKKELLKTMPDFLTYNSQQYAEALSDPEKADKIIDLAVRISMMKEVYDEAKIAADKAERLGNATFKINFRGKETSIGEVLTTIAGNIKSVKASFDISWGRQLTSAFLSGDLTIAKAAGKGWKEGLKAWKEVVKANTDEERLNKIRILEGLLMVRPNALNGNYARLGVAVGMREEAFPESITTKIPGVKNIFIASDKGFNIAIQTARAEITDALIDMAGGDIGMLKEQEAGQFVNELTGRGKLPFNNPNAERAINALLFAPRYLTSRMAQIYNIKYAGKWALSALKGKETGMINKMRARASMAQLAVFAVLIPAIKGILRAMDDEDVHGDDWWERFFSAYELRSSDFGKIVWGDTRIDVSAGLDGLLTLAARVVTGKTVSISGVKREKNWSDVMGAFTEGKLSPAARVVIDSWRLITEGEDAKNFMYQPITVRGLLADTLLPISVENLTELTMETESKSAQIVGILADIVGLGANTYGISEKDLGKSAELKKAEFDLAWQLDRNPSDIKPSKSSNIMKKLSGERKERAVQEYSKMYAEKADKLVKSSKYKNMSPEEKSEALTGVRKEVNNAIKKKYGLK